MPRTWHDDDEFWEAFQSALFTKEHWGRAPEQVDALLALVNPEPGARILDLCCGPGRHSLELARRGFRVTGVDRTERYLVEARKRAGDDGLEIEFVHADMREFVRPKAFDLVINLYTSFSYFRDPAEDRRVLENICESLVPGGALVIEMMGKEVLARIFMERDWSTLEDGTMMLQDRRLSDSWSWMNARWILVRDGCIAADFTVEHRLCSARELVDLVRGVGFSEAQAFGTLGGDPYDQNARRLAVKARK